MNCSSFSLSLSLTYVWVCVFIAYTRSASVCVNMNRSLKKRGGESGCNGTTEHYHVSENDFNRKPTTVVLQKVEKDLDNEVKYEFCGPVGVSFIMIGSVFFMYYLYACLSFNEGRLYSIPEFNDVLPLLKERTTPTLESVILYLGFVLFQALLAVTMPGPIIQGLPVISLGGKRLDYRCNGLAS